MKKYPRFIYTDARGKDGLTDAEREYIKATQQLTNDEDATDEDTEDEGEPD